MIRVFIGSHKRFDRVEPVIKHSILKHASEPVEINIMRPEYYGCEDSGCTGFSKMRYEIPRICDYQGCAIYLDVDMILMSDIRGLASLVDYFNPRFGGLSMSDRSDEVCIINCEWFGNKKHFHLSNRQGFQMALEPKIPKEWNCEDYDFPNWKVEDAKLIHYTDLKSQPWFGGKKYPELAKLWFDMEREAHEANPQ